MNDRRQRTRPDVAVLKRRRLPGVSAVEVRRDAQAILLHLGETDVELTVSLVGDGPMRELNRRYRGKDRPTDVLAFALREGDGGPADMSVLGDVIISLDTAARQARDRRRPLAAETRVLLVHGILHLLGYDHERGPAEARRMRVMELQLRRLLGRR